jgi:integrase
MQAILAGPVMTADAVRDYLLELKSLGRAEGTLKDLAVILGAFATALPRLDDPQAESLVEAWLNTLTSSGKGRGGKGERVSPGRRNKYLVCTRALCRWAMRRRKLTVDPTADLRMATLNDRLKPQFTVAELRLLLGGKDSMTRRWVLLMALCGLRADEARCMRWCDCDWLGGILMVRLASGGKIKRGRERIVPVQPGLREALEPFTDTKHPERAIAGLGKCNLNRAWDDYLVPRNITQNGRTPHSCRHTYAGLMTATGVPTALVGAYLGHSSAQTTMGYTRLAARYAQDPEVKTWARGELPILTVNAPAVAQ